MHTALTDVSQADIRDSSEPSIGDNREEGGEKGGTLIRCGAAPQQTVTTDQCHNGRELYS